VGAAPAREPEDFDSSGIDDAMTEVRDYNAEHKDKPLAVRLRIWGGFMAPPWVRKLGGLGVRCVFDNHNLDTEYPRPLRPIYALMKELGPEIVFQTWRTNPEDFEGTIKLGVAMGATTIELWQDYRGFPLVPNDQLKRWARMVEANDSP
jgi:hypothetical protein